MYRFPDFRLNSSVPVTKLVGTDTVLRKYFSELSSISLSKTQRLVCLHDSSTARDSSVPSRCEEGVWNGMIKELKQVGVYSSILSQGRFDVLDLVHNKRFSFDPMG